MGKMSLMMMRKENMKDLRKLNAIVSKRIINEAL